MTGGDGGDDGGYCYCCSYCNGGSDSGDDGGGNDGDGGGGGVGHGGGRGKDVGVCGGDRDFSFRYSG